LASGATLRISADLKNLAAIREFVQASAAKMKADPAAVMDMLQAVDESATNIIVHGYRGRQGIIEVEVGRDGSALIVRLRDQATLFDPTRVPTPDLGLPLDQRPFGGMGVYLTRRLTDRVTYRVTPQGGNELSLTKTAIPSDDSRGGEL
jgi:anti-sigma regulatory factor (Ser/Thr protein kinase)